MKIKTWIKYEEPYLPPRCRKLRYAEKSEYVNIGLRETQMSEMRLAFTVNTYDAKDIYYYRGNLYAKARMQSSSIMKDFAERGIEIKTPLDYLKSCNENCSTYFAFAFDREYYAADTSRDAMIAKAKADMKRYLLVDGELYEQTNEPRYIVMTFALWHNHGGTALLVAYNYNPNCSRDFYFNALQADAALAFAKQIATRRGDTESLRRLNADIIVHAPELVKLKANKDNA